MKNVFLRPFLHNEKKRVLSIKESNSNEKNGVQFSHFLIFLLSSPRELMLPLLYCQLDHRISVFLWTTFLRIYETSL